MFRNNRFVCNFGCIIKLVLGLLLSIDLMAYESADLTTEEDYYATIPIVITATRLKQKPVESPLSITVIDRNMIEASTAIELVDVLRLAPGLLVAHANGNAFSISYHGFASAWPNRMQVLVDGRSVYTPLFSIVDWNNIGLTLDDVEKIEIIRGANSASYGANAVRGTINIITRKAFNVAGQTISVTQGQVNTRRIMYRHAGVEGNLEHSVTFAANKDDGFDDVDDHKNIKFVTARGSYHQDADTTFSFQFGYSGGPVGAWGEAGDILNPIRNKQTSNQFIYLKWNQIISDRRELMFSLSHDFLDWDDQYQIDLTGVLGPNGLIDYSLYSGMAYRSDVEFQEVVRLSDKIRFVWGGGQKQEKLKDQIILNDSDFITVNSQQLFLNLEYRPEIHSVINSGVMAENNGLVGVYYSPRLAYNYLLNNSQSLRFSVSEARRTPSLYEYYNDNIARLSNGTVFDIRYKSDPELKEETIRSYEIGYVINKPQHGFDFDFKIFREEFRDIIHNVIDFYNYPDLQPECRLPPCPPFNYETFVWMNAGHLNVSGAEFQLKLYPKDRLALNLQYSYAISSGDLIRRIDPLQSYDERFSGYTESLVPKHNLSALLSQTFNNNWHVSLAYFLVSEMTWRGDGDEIDTYHRTDVKLKRIFRTDNLSGEISLLAQNLFDDYHEFSNNNNFTTRTYFQAKVFY